MKFEYGKPTFTKRTVLSRITAAAPLSDGGNGAGNSPNSPNSPNAPNAPNSPNAPNGTDF